MLSRNAHSTCHTRTVHVSLSIPPPGSLARKLGLTILCVLAARGCASDIEHAAARAIAARGQEEQPAYDQAVPPAVLRYDAASAREILRPYEPHRQEERHDR